MRRHTVGTGAWIVASKRTHFADDMRGSEGWGFVVWVASCGLTFELGLSKVLGVTRAGCGGAGACSPKRR